VDLAVPAQLQPVVDGTWPAWNRGAEGLGQIGVPMAGR